MILLAGKSQEKKGSSKQKQQELKYLYLFLTV